MQAAVVDGAGNVATVSYDFTLLLPLAVAIDEPADGNIVAGGDVAVAGTVDPSAVSVTVNGLAADVGAGSFLVPALPLHDGVNVLTAVATDAEGNLGTAIAEVRVDTTPPVVSIDFPPNGFLARSSPLTVSGIVNDLTVGTVNVEQVVVEVNGFPATVAHRSFNAKVSLVQGSNTLSVTATDRGGNVARSTVELRFQPVVGAETLILVEGDGQTAEAATTLPAPLTAVLRDAAAQPLANRQVVFCVERGNGTLEGGERIVIKTTDGEGRASVAWTLGSRAGAGVNRVRVTAPGVIGAAVATATATPGRADSIHVLMGDNQRGAVGRSLPRPLEVVVTDAGQNPVAGAIVTFRVTAGGGVLIDGQSPETSDALEIATDDNGMASARLILGLEPGFDNNVVEAGIDAPPQRPVKFRASGFLEGDAAETRISGVVLDNQDDPVPGYTLRAGPAEAVADAQGQFVLTGVPVGHVLLIADGTTATRPGVWTSLDFEMFTVAGVDNVLERPIYVLPMDVENGRVVGDDDVTVTVPAVPGFSLTIPGGSATFPDGSRSGLVTVTAVHADKIPMAPGAGMQPRFIVSIQPGGTHFDPPAPVTFPNVDALPPGTITEMFSFDHDLGAFVSIGTGTVSEDGTEIRSDPGFGIVKAGWHCAAPESGSGESAAIQVDFLHPTTIVICAGQDPPDTRRVSAVGTPSDDIAWTLRVFDSGIVDMSPQGTAQCNGNDPVDLCPDQPVCGAVLTAKSPGKTEILAQAKCCPSGHESEPDTVEVAVLKADLRIQGLGEDGDPVPNEAFPGALIPYLDPSIDDPEGFVPARLELAVEPTELEEGQVTLSVRGPVRVWLDEERTAELSVPKTWSLAAGETIPEAVFLEGTRITGFGGVTLELDYEGCTDEVVASVFGVDFSEIDVCDSSIDTWLLPLGFGDDTGPFSLRVMDEDGGQSADIVDPVGRGAGGFTDPLDYERIEEDVEYFFMEARWELKGAVSISRGNAHFRSFGVVRHTQYNIPLESDPTCTGADVNVCTRDPDPSQCDWRVDQMAGRFARQVARRGVGTGTGESLDLGIVRQEQFCQQHANPRFRPPPVCAGLLLFERDAANINPSCNGGHLGGDTVAVNEVMQRDENAPCGSTICIRHNDMGVRKVVTDLCPGCVNDQMDNFSLSRECGILDFDPGAITLRLYDP